MNIKGKNAADTRTGEEKLQMMSVSSVANVDIGDVIATEIPHQTSVDKLD